jgi:metal-responsive CopG/Arc/MetJ family transcriptional regulator
MKNIALKLQDEIFQETEEILKEASLSRNKYINEALRFYNAYQKRRKLKEKLTYESRMVADQSMSVLEDFEALYETD